MRDHLDKCKIRFFSSKTKIRNRHLAPSLSHLASLVGARHHSAILEFSVWLCYSGMPKASILEQFFFYSGPFTRKKNPECIILPNVTLLNSTIGNKEIICFDIVSGLKEIPNPSPSSVSIIGILYFLILFSFSFTVEE